MKLAKAKELNEEAQVSLRDHKFPDHAEAIRLTNEAVTWCLLARVTSPGTVPDLFYGETKE